ncbi:MAG: phosphate ABC transporter permease PstA [Hyphomicrobiales bacterium]|nr:phosphate ABC transporter permease PstA [Hyphomicrobiales bacterium]
MSDAAAKSTVHDWASPEAKRNLRRRYAADRRLQFYGLAAIGLAILLLGILVVSLISTGYTAFVQTKMELQVFLDPKRIDPAKPRAGNYRLIVRDSFLKLFPDVTSRSEKRALGRILSTEVRFLVRDYVVANPSAIGKTVTLVVPLSDPFDQLHKNVIPSEVEALTRREKRRFGMLVNRNVVSVEDGRTLVQIDAFIDPGKVDREDIADGDFDAIAKEGFRAYFPREGGTAMFAILAPNAADAVREHVVENPTSIGKTVQVKVPVSEHYATLNAGQTPKITNPRFASTEQVKAFEDLVEKGLVSTPFNWELFFNSDSRFPEQAGLAGAITGSFYTLLVCFLISFPVGIAAAVYLEEFAPKNRATDLIEVNINNLAAVPSVVFGLLGLAVFLGVFGLPRSAPLVGGMVLSLMTLPTIIIATRAALKAVPPSIREAALGVGASKHQVMLHHVLPLAMPGILTGTIIGLAQALGETAPLLLIGMNAFITSPPGGILEPATALPTQIYSWADSPERGFVARTSAAILVLLGFLVVMNAVAIFLRQRFERKW